MILYNKLYYIDKYGHKKIRKQMKPIFQSTKQSLYGNKKNDIIRVAQENLFMLKRLSERTSFYNVEKWNQDYEASQYYKKNHCLHPPIDFNKTQKYGSGKWSSTRKKFFSKTHYASMGDLDAKNKVSKMSLKKKKRFEDYNYRDLNLGQQNKSDLENKGENKEEKEFKKISEIDDIEKEKKEEINNNNNKKKENKENKETSTKAKKQEKKFGDINNVKNDPDKANNKKEKENKKENNENNKENNEEKNEKIENVNEEVKANEEEKEEGNEELKEPKKNLRDEREETKENGDKKNQQKMKIKINIYFFNNIEL